MVHAGVAIRTVCISHFLLIRINLDGVFFHTVGVTFRWVVVLQSHTSQFKKLKRGPDLQL